jgi:(p)ppGpp synthase/HD superfamily hydrolase
VFADRLHAGQRRQADGAPFIVHPIEVATLLLQAGASDDVVAAGLLHDAIEKAGADAADLRERFGPGVAALVVALSEDLAIAGYHDRKAALRRQIAAAGSDALLILAADKVSKARELRLEPLFPALADERKLTHYRHCLDLLEDKIAGSPLVRDLRAELDNIAAAARPALAAAV